MSVVSSTERLDMDGKTVSNTSTPGISIKDRQGCFVQRWVLVILGIFVLIALLAVGLLVGFLAPCAKDYALKDESSTATEASTTGGTLAPPKPYVRLPRSVRPVNYHVELKPFLGESDASNFTFNGKVVITILCLDETDNVTLHVKQLTIDDEKTRLEHVGGGEAPKVRQVSEQKEVQFLVLHLTHRLKKGEQYRVYLTFKGLLNDDLAGFYRSFYVDGTNEKRWLGATQFEATDARRAFPCFDEPAMKATFDVVIVRPSKLTSISNMRLKRSEPREDGWIADIYNTSVNMSTYLVAFVVSDFKSKSDGKAFQVWSRPDAINTAEYALKIGPKILEFYEDYFNISYPLSKMDMIALPDFNAGAMENWGLITYRETSMLFDPNMSSASNKQSIAMVIAHEIAHQWFGNLVTMEWWDDLWLNEGFATYVEYLGVGHVEKDWHMAKQFVVEELQDVMELDSLKSSHRISVPVNDPDEINENFDKISYSKAAAVIRMMDFFLTAKIFKKGIQNYLRSKSFQNARQDDLWMDLTEAQETDSKINIKQIMHSWTLQTGYPLVTVTRDYGNNQITFEQNRFLLDNEDTSDRTVWEIPVTYTYGNNANWTDTETKFWLNTRKVEKSVPVNGDSWFVANIQEAGFYKVNYDKKNWELLVEQLKKNHSEISVINRAQIVDDVLDLARAGILEYDLALNVVDYLANEEEYLPWNSAFSNFGYLDSMLSTTDLYGKWQAYVLKLMKRNYDRLTWQENDSESILKTQLRARTYTWSCRYGHQGCIDDSKRFFGVWKTQGGVMSQIKPNHRPNVYCTAIENGDYGDWSFLWSRYRSTKVASEQTKIMNALSCSKLPWILHSYIKKVITPDSGVRRQDGSNLIRAVSNTIIGRDIAFNFVREKWDRLYEIYGKSSFALSLIINSVTGSINTNYGLYQLKEFHDQHKDNLSSAQRAFHQGIEKAEANIKWMDRSYEKIKSWLTEKIPS